MNKSFFGIFLLVIALASAVDLRAYAQTADLSQPNIQTYSTATSSTTFITSPSGYKSEVICTYDNGTFNTFATSTPLTSQDIQNMQNSIQSEEAAIRQLFQQEQALFNEQEQMFDSLWGTTTWSY